MNNLKFIIKINQVGLGFIVVVNGIEADPTTMGNALALIRSVYIRFSKTYSIELIDECNFHLIKGELDFAMGKTDNLLMY